MEKDNHNRWQGADVDSQFNPLDNLYYHRARNKRGLPESAPGIAMGGMSNSSYQMASKSANASPDDHFRKDSLANVSQERREYIQDILERQGGSPRPNFPMGPSVVKQATLLKYATANPVGTSSSTDTLHIAPELYSPLFLTQNLQLPRDIITANAWNRAYYETNPIVRNAINLHATYPISKMNIKCEDPKVEQFFMDMMEKVDLETVVQYTALEFWKMGEAFIYASFDESTGSWDKIYLHNPDFISVKSSPIPGTMTIALRPDPELEKIITSNDPAHVKIRESLDPRIVHHVLMNEYIPLDSFNISHLKNLSAPYDVRGTSTIVSVWKDLMLYDKLRESKYVQADGMVNPLTLVKVGASNPDGHYPTREELETYREILEQATYDKNFKLVTHDAVDIQRIGYSGQVLDTSADFTMIIDNILMGLMVPKAIMTQEGATYASASVALDVMRQRYNNFRTLMANWLEQKIFAPIAEVQKFYKYENGVKRLIVPQVEWNHMTLYDLDNYLGHLMPLVDKKQVSVGTVYRSLGLDRDNELSNIRAESIQQMIIQKETEELGKMSLSELRALDSSKPVPEKPAAPLPGAPGGPGGPGGPPGGGIDELLGGPPGGGLPGMGPPGGPPPGGPGLAEGPGGLPPGGEMPGGGPPGGPPV